MKKLFVSIDRKYKSQTTINSQIDAAINAAKKVVNDDIIVVHSIYNADCVWFVDEWEDDIKCYEEHCYCVRNNIQILHDKSEFWNRET